MAARQGGGRGARPETGWKRRSGCRREVAGLETGRGKEFLGRGMKKKKAEMGWAERVGEREKDFHFFPNDSNTFNLNSNSKI